MKKITLYILFALVTGIGFQSCKKASPGDNYDFSNSIPPYVTLTSKSVSVAAGTNTGNVNINVRDVLEQAVTITYNLSGIVTATNQTVVLPKETLSVNAVVTRPATGTTTGNVNLTIVKATKADGTAMTIGQDNVAANQVAVVKFN
ncbi:hypothetical protein KXQ82_09945 [Mucilaginibacter sp. HMF5004]|uniref:hypothetical protein n=1 Tax=Mucilaginibacter rivuli TaxID=2857527 RepID=UPI001C5D1228|nr:hypothetical protein [Mucilaginibacter rivuli]MBW4890039.1 hypothetical protein [Mucilaginibacter rivuli]